MTQEGVSRVKKTGLKNSVSENPAVVEALQELLEKTRQVGRAMQMRREGSRPDYNKLARIVCDYSTANVYVLNSEGRILGYSWVDEYRSEAIASFIERGYMPESFIERISPLDRKSVV